MIRIVLSLIIFFFSSLSWAQSTNTSKIENQLICADSLFSLKMYSDVIKSLVPLETAINTCDNSILKFNYYSLLSASYLYNNDFAKCVRFMELCSIYNQSDLEDLICAANVSIAELGNYNDTKKYARRALIKYYENHSLEDKISINEIGRLLYLLGISYVNFKDTFMAEGCLRIHSTLNIAEQNEIEQDLTERLMSLYTTNSATRAISTNALIKVESLSPPPLRVELNQPDSIQLLKGISSYNTISPENVECFLMNVLSLDSIYELNQDVYSSKRLLDTSIQKINKAQVVLSSNRGIQLMIRLGRMYSLFRDNNEAIEWLLMAKNRCDSNGIRGNTYLTLLQLMANIYIEKDIFWSRLFIEEAIEIFEGVYGSVFEQNSSEAYSLLTNYACILQECGRYDIAETIYRHILKLCHESNAILFTLNNYGVLLSKLGRYDEAIYYYKQLDNIFPKVSHITNLIVTYIKNGDLQNAESTFYQYMSTMIAASINTWSAFTTYEIEKWWNMTAQEFYMSSNCFADKINSPKSLEYGFDATIFCKIFPMLYKSALENIHRSNGSTITKGLMRRIRQYKDELIKTKWNDSDSVYLQHLKIQYLEDSLKTSMPDLSQRIYTEVITYKDVSNALGKDEVAIEFFEYVDLLSDSLSTYYAAYIALPNTEAPIMVKIAPFQLITNAIRDILSDEIELNSIYSDNNSIFDKIWRKLIPYIADKKTIYYSTSGALSFINHDIIHDNNGNMLCDRFNMRRVSSTSQIGTIKDSPNDNFLTATLYGNINYDTTTSVMSEISGNVHDINVPDHVVISHDTTRRGWTNLAYSANEIYGIRDVMQTNGLDINVFDGVQANEESFRKLDGRASDVLHLATHGFSAYKSNQYNGTNHVSYTDYDQTMSFEGLLLSGANNVWLGKPIPQNVEDGILTAEEISELDLSGTKLVVLSACETGKGRINMIGRIIGLQEAFKMSGVQSILMSLWQVPDESTALLMTKFYEALMSGNTRHEALRIAMKRVREVYPDPYYWGAFVILD